MTPSRRVKRAVLTVADTTIAPGTSRRIQIPVARLATQTEVTLPVQVLHGKRDGPRLWLSAAIHGDELNGIEIIQRVLARVDVARLHGSILAVPVVNVFGFIHRDRYLPDRRDLNRSFPGSPRGSLASRLANLFMTEVVSRCTHGLDLHTGSNDRTNLPQVRADLTHDETRRCARAFGAPIMIQGDSPRGSLRDVASRKGIPIVVYEAGEPFRYDESAIDLGVRGALRLMRELGMYRASGIRGSQESLETSRRTWVRARNSGLVHLTVKAGDWVARGQELGVIRDVFGDVRCPVEASAAGLVIGHTVSPLVNQGDAVVHLARDIVRRTD